MNDRILIIDDSALMRKLLRQILESDDYEVATARNGQEGLEKVQSFNPAVITLDINMPVMDGLTCLSHIMADQPRPVIMVSSLTEKGALATFEAMALGAVGYIAKPDGTVSLNINEISNDLLKKVRGAVSTGRRRSHGLRARLKAQRIRSAAPSTRKSPDDTSSKHDQEVVIIGVSTGGPSTIETILGGLPHDFPLPIVIAQHMPGRFTSYFAKRLNAHCALHVLELDRPMALQAGQVIIARGDADIRFIERSGQLMISNAPIDRSYTWHPSVERLAESARKLIKAERLICVELTGMGNDGARTMAELHSQGACTIAESEETAVVYGMPRELVELDGASFILPSHKIAQKLIALSQR